MEYIIILHLIPFKYTGDHHLICLLFSHIVEIRHSPHCGVLIEISIFQQISRKIGIITQIVDTVLCFQPLL